VTALAKDRTLRGGAEGCWPSTKPEAYEEGLGGDGPGQNSRPSPCGGVLEAWGVRVPGCTLQCSPQSVTSDGGRRVRSLSGLISAE
jgi:hypothetical protein